LRHWSAVAIACSVLAACGGGSGSTPADAQAGAQGTAQDGRVQALAAGDSGWTKVADENQEFDVQGTRTVRYGSGSSWISRTVSGHAACSNAWFGDDPAFGVVKQCEIEPAGWSQVAVEGAAFSVSGTQTVRYGSGSSWITKTVSGSAECSNAYFGNDPLFGVVKQCEQMGSSESGWSRIAGEDEGFTVSGTQTVRYGSGSSWITKTVSGSGQCSNAWFGDDPLFGVAKQCEVAGAAQPPAVAGACTPPVAAADTSGVAASVGNGTPGSCTESALRQALASHDVVTFNCGANPATIAIGSQIDLPTDRNLVLDGGGKVTLDGGGRTRIFSLMKMDYRTNRNGLTLQHITLANGKAAGTGYVAQDPNRPQCAWGYAGGGGGAIEVRDARLTAIDVDFRNNAAASPGPDVGGGAIYAMGSLDITVVGSRFNGNSGSNGGAIGLLQSNGRFVNSVFNGNAATGSGMNQVVDGCPGIGHANQGGAGGNSGAIAVDGSDDTDLLVCGSSFTGNTANELAGALGRTPNITPRRTTIDRSLFQGNRARQAGALFVVNSAPIEILASTFADNSAVSFGAAQIEGGRLQITNSTFAGNEATRGVGGALLLGSLDGSSSIRNATFANNKSLAGGGYFSAAIFGQTSFPIDNTVFSNNLTNDGGSPMQCTFTPASGGADMQWPRNHIAGGAPDTPCVQGIAFADPLLGALSDNGGPTPTLQPAANSPLRNAGRNCPTTDQRGRPRNSAQCTIGAVE
jgi:hypothetical protein